MKVLIYISLLLPFNASAVPKLFFTWAQPYDKMCARGFEFENLEKEADGEKLKLSWWFSTFLVTSNHFGHRKSPKI